MNQRARPVRRLKGLFYSIAVALVLVASPFPAQCAEARDDTPPRKAFLTAQFLLDGWESTYGNMQSLDAAYVNHLTQVSPAAATSRVRPKTDWMHVEILRDSSRFNIRYSDGENGFDDLFHVHASSFDGQIGRSYNGVTGKGIVSRDREIVVINGDIEEYLFAQRYPTSKGCPPAKMGKLELFDIFRNISVENNPFYPYVSVRPELENIAGEWCHVVEAMPQKDSDYPAAKLWIAHGKGMILMKYEVSTVIPNVKMEVLELAKTVTKVGDIWYPQRAHMMKIFGPDSTFEYELSVRRFNPYPDLDDSMFRFKFPAKTRVADVMAQIVYTAGGGASDQPTDLAVYDVSRSGKVQKVSVITQHDLLSPVANQLPKTSPPNATVAMAPEPKSWASTTIVLASLCVALIASLLLAVRWAIGRRSKERAM